MPLINGMKMACEPCIRGHRSTKCTHANERLMVPVRKPGRPLSACPHPHNQACGCGTVTAAIPRKQACHCGSNSPTPAAGQQVPPRTANPSEAPSPTKSSFKISKPSRPSSRKQSFDPVNLERMDMNLVNVQAFEQRPQSIPIQFPNGYTIATSPTMYGYAPQYAGASLQYGIVPMQTPPHSNGVGPPQPNGTNGFSNSGPQNGLEHVIESPLATPTIDSRDSGKFMNGIFGQPVTTGSESKKTNGGSCCAPKKNGHSHHSSASSISEPPEPKSGSCCSSKPSKQEPMSNESTPQMPNQILPQNGMAFNPVLYPQYASQNTVFMYPATYGSFQNPLQPSAWRQNVRNNNYSHVPLPPGPVAFGAPAIPDTFNTIHTCSCGETCQCVGCAAHPYNDATQDYVRSAYQSMSIERPASDTSGNSHQPSNGNGTVQISPQPGDQVSSPTAHTPSSTTSGNGEEQSLSAADFFFVNYPFTSEGCGGDTQSCPCGDDCECLGCTIHRQPMPCAGDDEGCPCGDDCQCIGCEIHKNAPASEL